jgi:glycosyltransferase involved in cell wall biosynthesis
MIPTYNCAKFLRETLSSVLAQDPGTDEMQIEVVDDASTQGDPESVVRSIGKGRVDFFRKPKNEGVTPNFNTCLERSRGQLVHILHSDDFAEPGFYKRVQTAAAATTRTAAFFVRCRIIDEDGTLDSLSPRMRNLSHSTRSVAELLQNNGIFTPGVVIRRSCYEKNGGFLPSLVHCGDWEMWVRVISSGGGLWLNEPLASYRVSASNDTNRLTRSGENIRDRLRLAAIFALRFPEFDYGLCERTMARLARRQMQRFELIGDAEGASANRRLYRVLAPESRRRLLEAWDREIGIIGPRAPGPK